MPSVNPTLCLCVPVGTYFVYRWVASAALKEVVAIEGCRYTDSAWPEWFGWRRSIGLHRLMRDERLPRADYPPRLARRIRIARRLHHASMFLGVFSVIVYIILVVIAG